MVSGDSFQEVRDNLGSSDDTKNLVSPLIFDERHKLEEGPTKIVRKVYSGSDGFILGHAVYGKLGTATLGTPTNTDTTEVVVNPANTFHEHFRYTDFNDTAISTGSFDTTNFVMELDKNEIYQSLETFKNSESVYWVTPHFQISGGSVTFAISGTSKSVNVIEGKIQYV